MTSESIWAALDKLAAANGLTPSGLARRSGLHPTSFNPSKRVLHGRPRWLTFETLSLVLKATNTTIDEFLYMVAECEKEKTAK